MNWYSSSKQEAGNYVVRFTHRYYVRAERTLQNAGLA